MVESLQIRVHVAGVTLIDEAIKLVGDTVIEAKVEVDEQVRVGLSELELSHLGVFETTDLFADPFDVFVLRLVPHQVYVLAPDVYDLDLFLNLGRAVFLSFLLLF